MPTIKEFREFFLRAVKVNTGLKKDQESNYPTSYTINTNGVTKTVGNRFLKSHYPSEDVFKKLFESVTFKLNPEDTATTSQQGLVKLATYTQLKNGINTDNGYQLVATPADIIQLLSENNSSEEMLYLCSDEVSILQVAPSTEGLNYGCFVEIVGKTNNIPITSSFIEDNVVNNAPVYGLNGDIFYITNGNKYKCISRASLIPITANYSPVYSGINNSGEIVEVLLDKLYSYIPNILHEIGERLKFRIVLETSNSDRAKSIIIRFDTSSIVLPSSPSNTAYRYLVDLTLCRISETSGFIQGSAIYYNKTLNNPSSSVVAPIYYSTSMDFRTTFNISVIYSLGETNGSTTDDITLVNYDISLIRS